MRLVSAWILWVPFLLPALVFGLFRRDVARRMADMTGYTPRERIVTIAASLSPYPLLVASAGLPFTLRKPLLFAGLAVHVVGIAAFHSAISVFAVARPDRPLSSGIYRFSRTPMYVSATLVLFGICTVTASLPCFAWLAVVVALQQFMILAEERICSRKFGTSYREYLATVPRYLIC